MSGCTDRWKSHESAGGDRELDWMRATSRSIKQEDGSFTLTTATTVISRVRSSLKSICCRREVAAVPISMEAAAIGGATGTDRRPDSAELAGGPDRHPGARTRAFAHSDDLLPGVKRDVWSSVMGLAQDRLTDQRKSKHEELWPKPIRTLQHASRCGCSRISAPMIVATGVT